MTDALGQAAMIFVSERQALRRAPRASGWFLFCLRGLGFRRVGPRILEAARASEIGGVQDYGLRLGLGNTAFRSGWGNAGSGFRSGIGKYRGFCSEIGEILGFVRRFGPRLV